MRLLELEFKSDNTIKPKAMKYIVNRYIYIYKMETYCVSCKRNTGNKCSTVKRTKQNRLMVVSNLTFNKPRFIKSQKVH